MEPPECLKDPIPPTPSLAGTIGPVSNAQHPVQGERASAKNKIVRPYLRRAPRSSYRQNEKSTHGRGQQHLLRAFVVSQSEKNRLSKLHVCGPFMIGDLSDQPWSNKGDSSLSRRLKEGRGHSDQRLKSPVQRRQHCEIESRPHFAHISKLTVFMRAEEQSTKVVARTARRRITTYHKLIFLADLHFQPMRRPSLDVRSDLLISPSRSCRSMKIE